MTLKSENPCKKNTVCNGPFIIFAKIPIHRLNTDQQKCKDVWYYHWSHWGTIFFSKVATPRVHLSSRIFYFIHFLSRIQISIQLKDKNQHWTKHLARRDSNPHSHLKRLFDSILDCLAIQKPIRVLLLMLMISQS